MHIAAWIAHEEDAPAPIGDDSVRLITGDVRDHTSPSSRTIDDICQKMVVLFPHAEERVLDVRSGLN